MKYPLGIQHFTTIREEGWAYVDKTRQIHEIVTTGKFYFLSRPRRFGKSLTVSTLNELYTGNQALFEGLWIEDRWDWSKRHPVVWLRFVSMNYQHLDLDTAIRRQLVEVAQKYELNLPAEYDAKDAFSFLLDQPSSGGEKVVVLVDEYDKPIIDYLEDDDKVEAQKAILKAFYSVLKDAGDKLELLFITGVTAFSKVSLFSDLNHLINLTLDPAAATLTGITEAELDEYFSEPLADVDRKQLRRSYNGYTWDGEHTLYNPWSLLNFLRTKRFDNFWFQTGSPSFLIKLMQR